jgi:hypothetical protein
MRALDLISRVAFDYLLMRCDPAHHRTLYEVYHSVYPDMQWSPPSMLCGMTPDVGFTLYADMLPIFSPVISALHLRILCIEYRAGTNHIARNLFLQTTTYGRVLRGMCATEISQLLPTMQCSTLILQDCELSDVDPSSWLRYSAVKFVHCTYYKTLFSALMRTQQDQVLYMQVRFDVQYLQSLLPRAKELHLSFLSNQALVPLVHVESLSLSYAQVHLQTPALALRHVRLHGSTILDATARLLPALETVELNDTANMDWLQYPSLRALQATCRMPRLHVALNPLLETLQVGNPDILIKSVLKTNPMLPHVEVVNQPVEFPLVPVCAFTSLYAWQ